MIHADEATLSQEQRMIGDSRGAFADGVVAAVGRYAGLEA